MTVVGVGGAIALTGGAASPLVAVGLAMSQAPTATVAAATATGAVLTTEAGLVATGAAATMLTSGSWAAGVASVFSGSALATGATIFTTIVAAPASLIVVGSEEISEGNEVSYSFDCWKKVLREVDTAPSHGVPLQELLNDFRVKTWSFTPRMNFGYPVVAITNAWDEDFEAVPLVIDFHGKKCVTYHVETLSA
jgi:hypothetical protein